MPDILTYTPVWRTNSYRGHTTIEDAIIRKVNALRRSLGLQPLKYDARLRTAARQHSQEMIARSYYSHSSPVSAWNSSRRRACHAGFLDPYVAENIGKTSDLTNTASSLFTAWKRSPSHYATMVNAKLTRIGVGVAKSARGGAMYYATQLFGAIPVDYRKLTLKKKRSRQLKIRVTFAVSNGMAIMAWKGTQFVGNVPRTSGGFTFTAAMALPLVSAVTYNFGLKYSPTQQAMICAMVTVSRNGRLKVIHHKGAPVCRPVTRVSAAAKRITAGRWFLLGEVRANTRTALTTRWYLNRIMGKRLPLRLNSWQRFSRPLPARRTHFAVAVGRLMKSYLHLDPTSNTPFRCP